MSTALALKTQEDFGQASATAAAQVIHLNNADPIRDMGMLYIHNAAPLKGARPSKKDGRCFFILQCFRIPEGTPPGKVQSMRFHPDQAEYHIYYGLMARGQKSDPGLVVGYVDRCQGTVTMKKRGAEEVMSPAIIKTQSTLIMRPQVEYVSGAPRFGKFEHLAAGTDEHIATMDAIDAIRSPRPVPKAPRRSCI